MTWQQHKNTNEEDQKINRYEAEAEAGVDTQSIISYDDDIIKTLDQSRLERKLRKELKIQLDICFCWKYLKTALLLSWKFW